VKPQERKKPSKAILQLDMYGVGYFATIMCNRLPSENIFPISMSIASLISRLCCEISDKEKTDVSSQTPSLDPSLGCHQRKKCSKKKSF